MKIADLAQRLLTAIAPPVVVLENPDGEGVTHYVQEGHTWKHRYVPGKRKNRRDHRFASPMALADYLLDRSNGTAHQEPYRPEDVDLLVGEARIAVAPSPRDPYGDALVCEYRDHPELQVWRDVLGPSEISQRDLMRVVRAAPPESLDEAQRSQWLTALGVLKVVRGAELESHVDELGYTRLHGGVQNREVTTRIPPTITIEVPFFEGVPDEEGHPVRYRLDLLVEFDADELVFRLTCPMWPIVRARAVQDVADLMRRCLGERFLVVRGEAELSLVPDVRPDHVVARSTHDLDRVPAAPAGATMRAGGMDEEL